MRRRGAKVLAWLAALAGVGAVAERMVASPRYRGLRSDHFDGQRFHNPAGALKHDGSFLEWQLTKERGWWPEWIDAPYGPAPPARVRGGGMRVTFINHATLLLQVDDVNILTDPIWSERTSPVTFAGPRRHRAPGIRFQDLPRIDAVLVSHNHYDHLDVATLRRLRLRDRPRIITPLGNGALMARHGIDNVTELDWWQAAPLVGETTITCVPAQHFSARALSDRDANLWGGFVVGGRSGNVYFAGDTGWGGHFAEIGARFPIRLALLPIGAYKPRWFMRSAHVDPAEAVEAHRQLHAATSVAMHFGTFQLGDDGLTDPVRDLRHAITGAGDPRFWVLEQGEGRDVP
jgi:L-ascorbate metabolism protein UlaG (beta-lactamase superfamily)